MAKKGKALDNWNQVNVEKKGERWEIFRGGGSMSPGDKVEIKNHSHTVIENGMVVYDRDEYGTVFLDTKRGDPPAPTS